MSRIPPEHLPRSVHEGSLKIAICLVVIGVFFTVSVRSVHKRVKR